MSTETIKAPSGREFTYQPAGGDPDRIEALTALLCDSVTADADATQQVDNLFQAATSLFMELGEVEPNRDGDNFYEAVWAVQRGLSAWITRNALKDGE